MFSLVSLNHLLKTYLSSFMSTILFVTQTMENKLCQSAQLQANENNWYHIHTVICHRRSQTKDEEKIKINKWEKHWQFVNKKILRQSPHIN